MKTFPPPMILWGYKQTHCKWIHWENHWVLEVGVTYKSVFWLTLSWFLLICENINYQKIVSPFKMVHMGGSTIFHLIHKGPIHSNEVSAKNMLSLGQVVHATTIFPVYGEGKRGLNHLIFNTTVLYAFWRLPPHFWHELTQLISEIFRHVHILNTLHVNERSMIFVQYYVLYLCP